MKNAAMGQVQIFGPGLTLKAHRETLDIRAKEPRVVGLFKLLRQVPRSEEQAPIISSFRQQLVPVLKKKGFEHTERIELCSILLTRSLPEERGVEIIEALMNGAGKEEIQQLLTR